MAQQWGLQVELELLLAELLGCWCNGGEREGQVKKRGKFASSSSFLQYLKVVARLCLLEKNAKCLKLERRD